MSIQTTRSSTDKRDVTNKSFYWLLNKKLNTGCWGAFSWAGNVLFSAFTIQKWYNNTLQLNGVHKAAECNSNLLGD